MKTFLRIFLLSLISVSSFAADWDIVRDDGLYTYVGADSTIRVIAIGTTTDLGSGIILQNIWSPEIKQGPISNPRCVLEKGAGWLGRTVFLGEDGMQLIINKNKDTIRFNTSAEPGEWWKMMSLNFGREMRAKVNSFATIHLSGVDVSDSVKIIEINEYDENGNLWVGSPINAKKFYLSKNYGLVQTFDLFSFPDSLGYFSLRGKTGTTQIGIKPITFKEVFDFQVGDEFHIFEGDTNINNFGTMTWRRIKVLNKTFTESENIFDYEVDIKIMQVVWGTDFRDTAYSDNIANMRIDLNNYTDYLPEQSYLNLTKIDTSLSSNRFYVGEYIQRQVIRPGKAYRRWIDSCYIGQNKQGARQYSYIEGCGEFFEQEFFYGQSWKRLMYFNKSGKEYGKKLDFVVGVVDSKYMSGITISPNPAMDYIEFISGDDILSSAKDLVIKIYDVLGVEQSLSFQRKLESSSSLRIDVSDLAPGVYFVSVGNVVRKFVKI